MAKSPLLFTGGVGGGPIYSTDRFDNSDLPSPSPSREREGNR
jgi:hypothetical protein